jgi:hypothetical protein
MAGKGWGAGIMRGLNMNYVVFEGIREGGNDDGQSCDWIL